MIELNIRITPEAMTFLLQLFRQFKDCIDYETLSDNQKAAYNKCSEMLLEAEEVWSRN